MLLLRRRGARCQLCRRTPARYPSLVKVAELTGHSARVLSLAQSPDGTTVLSASADETLRFWRIFSKAHAGTRGWLLHAAETGQPRVAYPTIKHLFHNTFSNAMKCYSSAWPNSRNLWLSQN